MSGILDSKTRIMDTMVTLQGRRQLSNGGLNLAYVSFTDSTTFYSADAVSGSSDASARLYLESCNLPQDMLTFTADDSGLLLPFTPSTGSWSPDYIMKSGQLLSGSGANGYASVIDSSFASQAEKLTAASLQNFKNNYFIGSRDELLEDGEGVRFDLSSISKTFVVNDKVPLSDPTRQSVNINDMESFFNDPRLSRLPNFRYLPPLRTLPLEQTIQTAEKKQNETFIEYKLPRHQGTRPVFSWNKAVSRLKKASAGSSSNRSIRTPSKNNLLGSYRPLGSTTVLSDQAVLTGLQYFERMGLRTDVDFTPRPLNNHLFCQVFEQRNGSLVKLDILDFGRVTLENGRHGDVYFIGKVVTDENGTNTFLHIFTMVFESYAASLMKFSKIRSTPSSRLAQTSRITSNLSRRR